MRLAISACLLLAGCAGITSADQGSGDTVAEAACSHFHNVIVDAVDGVLTDDELRDKIREVADTASTSDVSDEAREMLSAATTGTGADFNDAVGDMSEACDRHR